MPTAKNYIKHKSELIKLIARGSTCFDCLAKDTCKEMCKYRNIDTSKQESPCEEAWKKWCDKSE